MRQTTKDKITKTVDLFAGPVIGLYFILTVIFMVEKPNIANFMILVPMGLFFAGFIGLLLFVIIFGGYHSVKNLGHEVIDIWKPYPKNISKK